MTGMTQMLNEVRQGGGDDREQMMSSVYAELRRLARMKMAGEGAGHTLQPTALVHEAWQRMGSCVFENRAHFFGSAAEAMRRILVDNARRRKCVKHGGNIEHVSVEDHEIAAPMAPADELLAVHEALDLLRAVDERKAELVNLRYFGGLSFEESAKVLGISVATAKRDWSYARAWLHQVISHR